MRSNDLTTNKKANRVINTIVICHFNNATELQKKCGYNGKWQQMTQEEL